MKIKMVEDVEINKTESIKKIYKKDVAYASLISIEEFNKYYSRIPDLNMPYDDQWWWTRSKAPSYSFYPTFDVYYIIPYRNTKTSKHGSLDVTFKLGVRPVLYLNKGHRPGFKFEFGGHSFTMLAKNLAICDDYICESAFRKLKKDKDGCIAEDAWDRDEYDKSDIKKVVESWFESVE